ncbi:glycosyltransferase family 4 protein [Candidatus Uhrbacteria bacterium]|nr:glycosyltransferase family 4 protein [Candidatus Uhrbacteria bacterium]
MLVNDPKKNIRVAEVTPVYPPYKGGIGMVAFENAKALSSLGYAVDVFTPMYGSLKGAAHPYENVSNNISVRRVRPLFERGNAAVVPQLAWLLSSHDIIHLHYPFLDAASGVLLVKTGWKKKKLVVTYHMDLVGRGLRAFIFRLYTACILPLVIKMADVIFVTSFDYARASHLKYYFSKIEKKVYELPCSVDTDHFFPKEKSQALLQQYSLKPDEKIILFCGGLDTAHYFKGVENLIASAAALPQTITYRLIIIGDGYLKPVYQKRAVELGIEGRVLFVGSVKHEMLPEYYNLADCVALPSIDSSEAFGIVLIEAGACGKPVIASSLPGVRSVVDHGKNGFLVTPNSIHELAEKLECILRDQTLAHHMGQEGLAKVQKRYSSHAVREKLSNIMTSLNESNYE